MNPLVHFESQLFVPLNVLLVVLFVTVISMWGARSKRNRLFALGSIVITVAASLAFYRWIDPSTIPAKWITVLHEGRSNQNIAQLYGQGVHAGPNFNELQAAAFSNSMIPLREVVWMNLWLASVNALLFLFIAFRAIKQPVVATTIAIVFVLNKGFLASAFAETPSQLLTAYFLGGVAAWGTIATEDEPGKWHTRGAFAVVVIAVVLSVFTRTEMIIIGLPVVLAAAAQLVWGRSTVRSWERALQSRLVEFPDWSGRQRRRALLAAGLFLCLVWAAPSEPIELRWIAGALNPLKLDTFLRLPLLLWIWLPSGVVFLAVLGFAHSLQRLTTYLVLPLSLVLLTQVYMDASHRTFYEQFRYLSMTSGVVFFLALVGWRSLEKWLESISSRWGTILRKGAAVALVVTLITFPNSVSSPLLDYAVELDSEGQLEGLDVALITLSRNQQLEIRYLIEKLEHYPNCDFLTRTQGRMGASDNDVWILFGNGRSGIETTPVRDESISAIAQELAPSSDCLVFFRNMDCNRTPGPNCDRMLDGFTRLDEVEVESRPYNDRMEYGKEEPTIRMGLSVVIDRGRALQRGANDGDF